MIPEHALEAVRSGCCDLIDRMAENGVFENITVEGKSPLVRTAAETGQSVMLRFLFENHQSRFRQVLIQKNLLLKYLMLIKHILY